ncbi:beta-galactosidase trimerization domain-containing protein [Microbacterium sp. WCS2018Hpa-23]|uniref:beta-galactosidase trimerization domain-containing protein n=1 Tax=Microbacterium sp. WCS2018Hpa-23 TaxID=3073634 RepID=UPI0037CBE2A8
MTCSDCVSGESKENAYVRSGGHVLISFFSGIVDEHYRVIPGGYPGRLLSLIGGRVREISPLPSEERIRVNLSGSEADAGLWQDDLVSAAATVLATYADGHLEGQAAALRHELGDGVVTYLGTQLSEAGMHRVLDTVLDDAQVRPVLETPAGVEAVERHGPEVSYLFLLNHGQRVVEIDLPRNATDLLAGGAVRAAGDTLNLEAAAVAVLKCDR